MLLGHQTATECGLARYRPGREWNVITDRLAASKFHFGPSAQSESSRMFTRSLTAWTRSCWVPR
jgi:hypothetical protein